MDTVWLIALVVVLGASTQRITGMGFALFKEGRLAPHLELGQHIAHKDMTYDQFVGEAGLKDVGRKDWQ